MSNELIFFSGFAVFVVFVMLLDLGAFSKGESHIVKFKEAAEVLKQPLGTLKSRMHKALQIMRNYYPA